MTQPMYTPNFAIPLQQQGQASRGVWNQAVANIDSLIAQLTGNLQTLALQTHRLKKHAFVTAFEGQQVFDTAESYVMGRNGLIVFTGPLLCHEGVDWVEVSPNRIQFLTPRFAGEKILILEQEEGAEVADIPTAPTTDPVITTTETPVGAINSTDGFNGNGTFELAHPIAANTVPKVIISRSFELAPGSQFLYGGSTIEILPGNKPTPPETVSVEYQWRF